MLKQVPIHLINRLLGSERWAAVLLQKHAGQNVALDVAGIPLRFGISEDGLLQSMEEGTTPDVEITVPANALPAIFDGMEGLTRHAQISGNAKLAETLQTVARYLRPDLAAALSPYLGNIVALRIDQGVKTLSREALKSARNLGENVLEYVRDEKSFVVRQQELSDFTKELARLRDDVARLEKRTDKLTKHA